ncbi:hypothetical protein L3Q82_003599 [Scortum barcoo]|uniref:Uncharacterized protein n=1 Tax=Scortum barcoo TaxID=214431 RepID=A0ACB8VN56_9TELE|nr:hypothetical protein L3Q82_003599 [Scortum barcoo]
MLLCLVELLQRLLPASPPFLCLFALSVHTRRCGRCICSFCHLWQHSYSLYATEREQKNREKGELRERSERRRISFMNPKTSTMPGLINKENRSALPLSVSDITSCVRGYTLAMTASMTYENIEDHAIEGMFIYPLEENSIVVGFESMISSQIITLQIKDKAKIEDCYLDCCSTSNGALHSGSGHIVMDEDLERTVLVVNLGVIPPMETVHILVSTSSELSTLPSGGISVSSPPVCTPRVQRSINEEQGLSPNFSRARDRHTCASSPHDQTPSTPQLWLASLLEEEVINSMDYEFNFQLEIRAPYLLAGVESPSHAIRADADPLARSATSVVITLADKYTYDCPVKILIYPSEPHLPHVLIENGDMMQEEYDEYLHARSDFIKATKKDSSNERKVDIIHRRLHKDILHNPVVMLNFCPDLKSISSDLRKVHGEFIFLLDRSGSMSGVNINRVKFEEIREASRGHPKQMPKPPQLTPLECEGAAALLRSSSRVTELLTLSLRERPATLRRKLISAACIRDDVVLSVITQSS